MESRNRHSAKRNIARAESEIPYPREKRCSLCGSSKAAAEFSKAKRETDGLKSNCKACASKQKRSWYLRNAESEKEKAKIANQHVGPERKRSWAKKTYLKHLDSRRARGKQAYLASRKEISAKSRERYASDKEYRLARIKRNKESYARRTAKIVAYRKKYRATHTEEVRIHALQARCRKFKAPGKCSSKEWEEILNYYDHHCAYCLEHESVVGKLAMDHIEPLTRGGSNDSDNIVPACKSCNSSKHSRTLLEFAGGLSARRGASLANQ